MKIILLLTALFLPLCAQSFSQETTASQSVRQISMESFLFQGKYYYKVRAHTTLDGRNVQISSREGDLLIPLNKAPKTLLSDLQSDKAKVIPVLSDEEKARRLATFRAENKSKNFAGKVVDVEKNGVILESSESADSLYFIVDMKAKRGDMLDIEGLIKLGAFHSYHKTKKNVKTIRAVTVLSLPDEITFKP